jgi:hypothetical protein
MFERNLVNFWSSEKCEVVYINNSDKNFIKQIYLQYHPNYLSVAVLLDIYHARARVIKYHPNFRAAKQNLARFLQYLVIWPFSNIR